MRFLVHGSIAYDLLLTYDGSFVDALDPKALDRLSVSYLMPRFKRHHGGTAANIAWNLRLLNQEPLMVGSVGSDGGPYLSLLQGRGIDTRYVQEIKNQSTATAIVATDDAEHQITFFHPGADAHGELPKLDDERDDLKFAIISPRDPVFMLRATAQCQELKIPYLFDPGQQSHIFTRDEFRRAVSGSAGLIVNEYEWTLAEKKLEWDKKQVIDSCGLLIITLGDKGMVLTDRKEKAVVHSCKPDKVVNPTGAGDAARAGILYGLAAKWPLKKTGQLAAIMGSFLVEQEGTLLDNLDREMIQERALESYGEELSF
jgi:adenosine kinase